MTVALEPTSLTVPALALRLLALRGTATYAAYLAKLDGISDILAELAEELVAFGPSLTIAVIQMTVAGKLVIELPHTTDEIVLVNTASYDGHDWALLDRRRSSLAHTGVMVFVMTRESLEDLMRSAPNLASWLGALVFQHAHEALELAGTAERRLAALRSWAQKSDIDVVHAATRGELPTDPEYAEWLVLLGRGDLLDQPIK